MEQIIKNFKLIKLTDKPTRTTSHSATLIDIVTNAPALALHHDVIACPIADHDLICHAGHYRTQEVTEN